MVFHQEPDIFKFQMSNYRDTVTLFNFCVGQMLSYVAYLFLFFDVMLYSFMGFTFYVVGPWHLVVRF